MTNAQFLFRLVALTVAAVVVGVAWLAGPRVLIDLLRPPAEPREITARPDLPGDERSVIETFEAARDSVVFITTSQRILGPFGLGGQEVPQGSGSGFVWDDNGHIVTNNHVIAGASGAFVRLADGETHEARLVGASPLHDLAVLRLDVATPPPLPIGASAELQVGQKVLAIGNPFGLDWTLTTGIVSALDREIPAERGTALRGLIQTDAAINPGNSGGPLLDSAGRLIGVNTAIFSLSGGSAGIGFAVPVDTVNRIVPQIIENGSYAPPRLGIEFDQRVNELARRQGMSGVLVLGVVPGSAADRAGLRPAEMSRRGVVPGDIVTRVGETEIDTAEDLMAALDGHRPGDEVEIGYLRDGRERQATVTLDPPA